MIIIILGTSTMVYHYIGLNISFDPALAAVTSVIVIIVVDSVGGSKRSLLIYHNNYDCSLSIQIKIKIHSQY